MATDSLFDSSEQLRKDFLSLGDFVLSVIKDCRRRNQPLSDATATCLGDLVCRTCDAVQHMCDAIDEHIGLEPESEEELASADHAAEVAKIEAKTMSKALRSVKRAARLKIPRSWN